MAADYENSGTEPAQLRTVDDDAPVVVHAPGVQLVTQSAQLRNELLNALTRADWVELDCSATTDADLTFFQILCSAHHAATVSGKRFTLNGNETETFRSLTHSMGLERHVGCVRDVCRSCIWIGDTPL